MKNTFKRLLESLAFIISTGLSVGVLSAGIHQMTGLPWSWSAAALFGLLAWHLHEENEKKKKLFQEMLDHSLSQASDIKPQN